jgi:hypothetical protein
LEHEVKPAFRHERFFLSLQPGKDFLKALRFPVRDSFGFRHFAVQMIIKWLYAKRHGIVRMVDVEEMLDLVGKKEFSRLKFRVFYR